MKHPICCLLLGCALAAQAQDRVVGYRAGQAVLESEVAGTTDEERARRLGELIVNPAVQAYLEPHRHRWEVTEHELDRYVAADRARQACRPAGVQALSAERARNVGRLLIPRLKRQRFIHERHGGGRLRFQQAGIEAFDATQQMLLTLEREGQFQFVDPAWRAIALGYWLEPRGPLMPDPGPDKAFRIEQLFEPCPPR